MDQRGDERHHHEHDGAEAVDVEAELQDRCRLLVVAARPARRDAQPVEPAASSFASRAAELLRLLAQRLLPIGSPCLGVAFCVRWIVAVALRDVVVISWCSFLDTWCMAVRRQRTKPVRLKTKARPMAAGGDVGRAAAGRVAAEEVVDGAAAPGVSR